MSMRRVCLVGAGNIAQTHAEVLAALPGRPVTAVVDANEAVASKFAERWRIPNVFTSVTAAIAADAFDCAHVLVPPPLHRDVAEPLLDAGKATLIEKPMATTLQDCEALATVASRSGAVLAVNQNYVYTRAFTRLKRIVETRRLGRLLGLQAVYSMPLRQLQARQFGNWMFREAGNILLEQAVHPLSQIAALIGPFDEISASAGRPIAIAPGRLFFPETAITLRSATACAQLQFAVGRSFPVQTMIAICEDGAVTADLVADKVVVQSRTRWVEPLDQLASGLRLALEQAAESAAAFGRYTLAMARIGPRSDPFFVGMRGSIAAFHASLDGAARPFCDASFGTSLVGACEAIARSAFASVPTPSLSVPAIVSERSDGPVDVALLGGTGFIGTATVKALTEAGLAVAVAARSIECLPETFQQRRVRLVRADTRRRADVERAIADAPIVINLAHGGGGANRREIEEAVVGSARTVAQACLDLGTKRLVHVGSIAALYLGDPRHVVTGNTQIDPLPDRRADYARAKALADTMLLDLHASRNLPVCIIRPGVVVGEGASPFHSGIGSYNNEQHCLGWNAGRNPLPFVLVEDVAAALCATVTAPGIEGKCYNLVGDVRLTAREYIRELAEAMQRPLRFHPQSVLKLFLIEMQKWLIKTAVGRSVPLPSMRDLRSRGLNAQFDCTDAKRDLGWSPVADRAAFIARAISVHAAR